jgi:8-oxo-dGTP pyrophosphatase MutT (NUDIX family)
MPAIARDATSIVLLRDDLSLASIEVLMVKRHARSEFAGDMYVFPGGAVEECDCEESAATAYAGVSAEEAMSIVDDAPSSSLAMGILIAGIRETFEETGILLARDASGEMVSYEGQKGERYANLRERMHDGELTFSEMIVGEGLELAIDRLTYFAHWITPELSPIRYDTRFFLAQAPPHQNALHDNVETTEHLWIAPREALERSEGGTFAMLPPTIINLMALAPFSTVEDALAGAEAEDVSTILPRVRFEGGKPSLLLSDDPEYRGDDPEYGEDLNH